MSNLIDSSYIALINNNIADNYHELNFYIPKKLVKDNKIITINNRINQNKIIDYISLIKIIACFSVIILHTNGKFWNFSYDNYKQYWISANLLECLFYFGVPFFILCIGATLLDFNEKYG